MLTFGWSTLHTLNQYATLNLYRSSILSVSNYLSLYVLLANNNITAPSFVPKNNGIVSPMPKAVQALSKNQSIRRHENTIKMMPVSNETNQGETLQLYNLH